MMGVESGDSALLPECWDQQKGRGDDEVIAIYHVLNAGLAHTQFKPIRKSNGCKHDYRLENGAPKEGLNS
jgi:hypothetical protein